LGDLNRMAIPVERYAVYAEFGFAAERGQLLETEAGNLALGYLTLFFDTKNLSAEEKAMLQSVTEDLNEKTLGTLLGHIKKTLVLDDSITRTLDEALDLRNHLTHHFFRTHNFALFSEDGRKLMIEELLIEELHKIQDKLNLALATLQAMTGALERTVGKESLSEEAAIQLQTRGKKVNI
jgi:hypothetical protein